MTSLRAIDMDDYDDGMLAFLLTPDSSPLDTSFQKHSSVPDCTFRLTTTTLPLSPRDDLSHASTGRTGSDISSPGKDRDEVKRRKHRESMARLRQTWRTSIALLQQREQHLQTVLRRAIASTKAPHDSTRTRERLRQSYGELVREQLQLQAEQASLEAACTRKEKYTRLVHRERERVRTFRVTMEDVGASAPHDPAVHSTVRSSRP